MESRIAVHRGSSPNAYTPNDAALSEEPWPTNRTRRRSRSRTTDATPAISASCSSRRRSAAGCSRISARNRVPISLPFSACDKRLSPDEGADDLEGVVEGDEVADRLDHRERAAREHPVLAADDVVGDHDLDLAERIRAVAQAGARDR